MDTQDGTEFGIFSDEGKIVGDFFSREEAEAYRIANFTEEDEVVVAACCHDHPDHEAETCEHDTGDEDED